MIIQRFQARKALPKDWRNGLLWSATAGDDSPTHICKWLKPPNSFHCWQPPPFPYSTFKLFGCISTDFSVIQHWLFAQDLLYLVSCRSCKNSHSAFWLAILYFECSYAHHKAAGNTACKDLQIFNPLIYLWKSRKSHSIDRKSSQWNMRRPILVMILPQELEISHKVKIKCKLLLYRSHQSTEKALQLFGTSTHFSQHLSSQSHEH